MWWQDLAYYGIRIFILVILGGVAWTLWRIFSGGFPEGPGW